MNATESLTHTVDIWRLDGSKEKATAWFQELHGPLTPSFLQIRHEVRQGRRECCALCRVPFQSGDFLTLAHSNHVHFPSCFLHTACMTWNDLTGIARKLRDDWDAAQRYAHWF